MKIIAHGGGERSASIKFALDVSGAEKPQVLLVPSSSKTLDKFELRVGKITSSFGEFGVRAYLLHEFDEDPSTDKIANEIGRADLLYTIGGNSPHMLSTMHRHGSDTAVRQAILDGKVHAGTSAGALLPFELGHSNPSANDTEEHWDYEYLQMLGLIPGVVTAHANMHDNTPDGPRTDTRMDALLKTFPAEATIGYAIENNAALAFIDGGMKVIRSRDTANVYVIGRDQNNIPQPLLLDR